MSAVKGLNGYLKNKNLQKFTLELNKYYEKYRYFSLCCGIQVLFDNFHLLFEMFLTTVSYQGGHIEIFTSKYYSK
jgi:hypothetical protein